MKALNLFALFGLLLTFATTTNAASWTDVTSPSFESQKNIIIKSATLTNLDTEAAEITTDPCSEVVVTIAHVTGAASATITVADTAGATSRTVAEIDSTDEDLIISTGVTGFAVSATAAPSPSEALIVFKEYLHEKCR